VVQNQRSMTTWVLHKDGSRRAGSPG
jgi:hypothetical protein